MIKILYRIESGRADIVVSGHANTAPYGSDIVCAAVSAIIQTALLGLEAVAKDYPNAVKIKEIKNEEDID